MALLGGDMPLVETTFSLTDLFWLVKIQNSYVILLQGFESFGRVRFPPSSLTMLNNFREVMGSHHAPCFGSSWA